MTTIYVKEGTALPRRREHELYPTEWNLIRAALSRFVGRVYRTVLDPGAGDGRWGLVLKALSPASHVHGVEIRPLAQPPGFEQWWVCNFLMFYPRVAYELIIGNPPYGPILSGVTQAEHFIRKAWSMLACGGRMIFLFPLSLQASETRYDSLWVELPPTLVAVCSRRPSFGKNQHGRRGTNGTDYAIFVWDKTSAGGPLGIPRRWPTELISYEPDNCL